jgi:drug/metabolite transporter (DMT)-like permease
MTQGSKSAVLLAALGAMLFSAKAVVVKLCYRHGADAETVLALRMLFSLPFFWAAVWWQTVSRRPAPMLRGDRARVLLLGFVGYYLSSYLDFLGLEYVSAGLERIILYLNPTMVLVVSALALGKRIDSRQWLAMVVAYAGVLLVFFHDVRVDGEAAALGSALVFTGAITYAIYLIFAGEIVNRVGSIRLVAYASASSTFFCVLQAVIMNPLGMLSQAPAVYGLSLLNASLCTFVPMLLIMAAVKQVGSGLAAQSGVVGPVATVFMGWYFLGEPIGLMQVLGVVMVLVSMGILLTVSRPSVPPPRKTPAHGPGPGCAH